MIIYLFATLHSNLSSQQQQHVAYMTTSYTVTLPVYVPHNQLAVFLEHWICCYSQMLHEGITEDVPVAIFCGGNIQ